VKLKRKNFPSNICKRRRCSLEICKVCECGDSTGGGHALRTDVVREYLAVEDEGADLDADAVHGLEAIPAKGQSSVSRNE
jgi:hypothetical protein